VGQFLGIDREGITTLLISGSRTATPAMLDYAAACTRKAALNGWHIICGDAFGVDWQVVYECQRVGIFYMSYGITEAARNGARVYTRLDVRSFSERDRWMVEQADAALCITTKDGTPGTLAVYNYAIEQGKEAWLRKDYR